MSTADAPVDRSGKRAATVSPPGPSVDRSAGPVVTVSTPGPPSFPFAAVVGTDEAKLALLLAVVDPRLGGVLLRGDKGSAKSTLVRSLAALLPADGGLTELPLGATEERVAGSLDLAAALGGEGVRFSPGVLANAHDGLLYVDEVNLLADHLVDLLLDAAASGRNTVERDGVSHSHDARFVLVGSMNPEEGDLRPQLLDRFGLAVDVRSPLDPSLRAEVVRRRLAFDADPDAFAASWAGATSALASQLSAARPASLSDELLVAASTVCAAAGAQGLRADLTLARAAAAHAGWAGRTDVTADDVRAVAHLVLAHRGRRQPLDGSSTSADELRRSLDEGLADLERPSSPPDRPADEDAEVSGAAGPGGDIGGVSGVGRHPAANGHGDAAGGVHAGTTTASGRSAGGDAGGEGDGGRVRDRSVRGGDATDAARRRESGSGPGAQSGPDRQGTGLVGSDKDRRSAPAPSADGCEAPVVAGDGQRWTDHRVRLDGSTTPSPTVGGAPVAASAHDGQVVGATVIEAVTAAAARPAPVDRPTTTAPRPRGRTIGHRPMADGAGPLAVVPTAQTAALRHASDPSTPVGVIGGDLREVVRSARVGHLVVLAVDASGSMGVAADRLAAVKGALLALLVDAYQRRDRVALVTFHDDAAHVVLEPTASVELARRRLDDLAIGGTTPLAAGLRAATDLARRHAADDRQPVVVLVTDGRATVTDRGLDPAQAVDDALAVAASVVGSLPFVVVDVEDPAGPRLGLARRLADALHAAHVPLGALSAGRLEAVLRGVVTEEQR